MHGKFTLLIFSILSLVFLGNINSSAIAAEPSSSSSTSVEAQYRCMDSERLMSSCRSFITGFLKGALLTDIAIIKSIDESAEETFFERAIKTRLNRRHESPTALAGFCLPPEKPILDITEETLDHVKQSKRDSHELARNVYKTLKIDFPCQ